MRKITKLFVLFLGLVVLFSLSFSLVSCKGAGKKQVVVGFSQIGAESEWRNANTFSVLNTFGEDPDMQLIFSDAMQKQENQIKALRSFIARKVDVIL